MSGATVRNRQSGQAAVESIGLAIAIAALFAAAAIWAAAHVRAPDAPPPIVAEVTAALDGMAGPAPVPDLGIAPRGRRPPIGRALRGVGRVLRVGGSIAVTGASAFGDGVGRGVTQTVHEFIANPVGTVVGGGEVAVAAVRDPAGLGAAAVEYARELRALPPREAYRRVMRDLGELTVDAAVTRGKMAARRAVLRALRRRIDAPPPRPPGAP